MTKAVKVGDKIAFWASGSPDGFSTVLEMRPYTGKYTNMFNCVLKLTAQNTTRGWMEMSYKQPEEVKP